MKIGLTDNLQIQKPQIRSKTLKYSKLATSKIFIPCASRNNNKSTSFKNLLIINHLKNENK